MILSSANGLPYSIPIHPNLVHLTLGLFILAIAFDIVAALYPLEKPIFKFLAIPVTSSNLYDVGWFNMVAAAIITFFTVAAGFYEIILAEPPMDAVSPWGLGAHLASDFGVHITADRLLREGITPNAQLLNILIKH